jgi:group I intron endonuclease
MISITSSYKYYFIYMIKNLINTKCYVGFHATNKEFGEDTYYGSSKTLNAAIKKYGKSCFVLGIIEYINVKNWSEKEQYWIKKMSSHISVGGYNLNCGGKGCIGYKWSKQQKESLDRFGEKNSMYGKTHTNETIKNISKTRKKNKKTSGEKNGMFGTSAYDKWVEKFGKEIANKKSIEWKNKISENSTHTSYERTDKIINKLKESHKNIPKIQCEWCGKFSQPSPHKQFHGDNCKFNPHYKREEKLIICPYCNFKSTSILNMNKWHFDNCKYKKI